MTRKVMATLLLGLLLVTLTPCLTGIDAARQAGERAGGVEGLGRSGD